MMLAITIGMSLFPIGVHALDTADTRLLSTPAITEGKIAFVYADDIWVADADGSNPRRVTSHPGEEQNPYFSPDGKHIAFTASYDGNDDVYVIPTEGGEPTRLTWHPGDDIVRGFTPDGKVLFSSQRAVFSRRHAQFYTVGIAGGVPDRLPIPTGRQGGHLARREIPGLYAAGRESSASGRTIAAARPRGSGSSSWMTCRTRRSPSPPGAATTPSRCGSARRSTSSPIATASSTSTRTTGDRKTVDALHPPRRLPDRQRLGRRRQGHLRAGRLDPPLRPDAIGSRTGSRSAWPPTSPRPGPATPATPSTSGTLGISPSGKRAVLEYRGEIVTVPAKKGDPHNLTQTPGAHERSPAWSPDGKSIAYFSDATGEYQLVVRPQDGKGEGRSYPLKGSGFYEQPAWSPDSKKIAFIDNSRTLYWIDLATRRRQADRRRADLRAEPGLADELRLVARLEVAGLLAHQPRRLPGDLALRRSRRTSPTP